MKLFVALAILLPTAMCASLVTTSPHLPYSTYAPHIHPYAWSSEYPMPSLSEGLSADSSSSEVENFLKLKTHLRPTEASSLLEVSTATKNTVVKNKFIANAVSDILSSGALSKEVNDPANQRVPGVKPNHSPFEKEEGLTMSVTTPAGETHQRRAVFGLRRRRVPYAAYNDGMGSVNPFRLPNNNRNAPQDFFVPKNRFDVAMHPELSDVSALAGKNALPYGGFSSFRNQRLRAMVGQKDQAIVQEMRAAAADLQRGMHYSQHPMASHSFRLGTHDDPHGYFSRSEMILSHHGGLAHSYLSHSMHASHSLTGMPAGFYLQYPQALAGLASRPFESDLHPQAHGPSPYIPGDDYQYHDVYNNLSGSSSTSTTGGSTSNPTNGEQANANGGDQGNAMGGDQANANGN